MKLTLMRDNSGTLTMRTLDITLQIEAMKHETKARPISNLRTSIRHASPDCKLEEAQKLTKVIPAANFRKTTNGTQMTAYNGIVQIEVNHLANRTEVNRVKQEAAELTQTLAAFMGSSGHSVKIWLRFTRPDKSLPKSREEAEIFQAHAYRKAVGLCQPALSYAIELKKPTLDQFCRQTYDPELYYNPDSTVIYMRQPLEMPSDTTYKETVQAENSPFKRLIPGYDSFDTLSALFEVALNKAYHSLSELHPNVHLHSDDDLKPLLVQLAENCFQSGIPEEETARWAIAHFYTQKKEFLIRQTVQNVYLNAKGFGKKSPLSAEQELELRTEEFMQRRYEFRYNTMTTVTEYRERNTFCFCFRPVTNRIDFSNKRDAELSLNRFALINMDEFDQNRESQQAFLKHIIQKPVVNTRRPHGVATQELRRYASFIGTSNHKDLLTDTSGSRRYIVIAVTGPIDCSPIDYEQLYAQAIHDIYKGERYWFNAEDEKVMTESNQEFQVIPIAEQLFHQYFRAAREDEEEYELLLAIEILEQVQHDSRIRISNCNIIQFGRILQRNQVPSIHAKRGNVYKVVRIKPKRA